MKKLLLFCLMTLFATPIHAQAPQPHRIAFWVDNDLYTINSDGSGLLQLEYNPQFYERIESAVWSPGGEQLALVMASTEDFQKHLYVADGDGDNPRLLMDDPIYVDAVPQWSPDGSQIIFVDAPDGRFDLFVIDADADNRQRIAEDVGDGSHPKWSPDGTQVAYLTGYIDYLNIAVLDLTTGESREVVHELTDGIFAWSPAGDYIAFHHWDGGDDVYSVNLESGAVNQLVQDEHFSDEYTFDWSPDGTQIAVTSYRGDSAQIYTMNPDGSDLQQLTDEADGASMYAYSPDGQWMAYSARGEVWIMHPDGSGARQMTFDEEDQGFVQWSPGSDEIMLLQYGFNHTIRIVNVEKGDFRDLPTPPGDVRFPRWIP